MENKKINQNKPNKSIKNIHSKTLSDKILKIIQLYSPIFHVEIKQYKHTNITTLMIKSTIQ